MPLLFVFVAVMLWDDDGSPLAPTKDMLPLMLQFLLRRADSTVVGIPIKRLRGLGYHLGNP
jgi:hypothetical protein